VNLLRSALRGLLVCGAACLLPACGMLGREGSGDMPHAASPASRQPGSFAPALRRALPPVIGVYGVNASATENRADEPHPWSGPTTSAAIGAGFFIDEQGFAVTAAHVVVNASRVIVKLSDQRVFEAALVSHDAETDIALIKVPLVPSPTPAIGRSTALRAGDWVLAVGEPYGLARSVVAGVVGGRTRHFADDREGLYLQSDLALNPGNSGGPLLDANGAIVGMNLRTVVGPYGTAGVSLSIPIETVVQVVSELQSGQPRMRPRLGASFEDVSPLAALAAGRAYASGALVTEVSPNSAARLIGLRASDIVVGMNGVPLEDSADLARLLLSWRVVSGTQMVVYREGRYELLKAP
jgi:serine protease Do